MMRGASPENSPPREDEAFGNRPDLQTRCLDWITNVEIALRPKP
jgi:hypothetical protein